MEFISSKTNEKIKYAVKLRDSSSFRKKENSFFIESPRLLKDAYLSGVEILMLFVTEEAKEKYWDYIKEPLETAKKSFIAPSATMTVHPVRTNGLMIGVPRMMNHFARMQSRITEFVVNHSNITPEKFTELMMNTKEMVTDVGSVISGDRAVEVGLIDSIGNLSTVIETLYKMIDETK